MSKHFLSKSALTLSLVAAALASSNLVHADETTTAVTEAPVTSLDTATVVTPASETSSPIDTPADSAAITEEQPATEEVAPTVTEAITPTATPQADKAPIEGQTVDVRILSTTDLHTNLVNYDYYQDKPAETIGLAKTAVLLEEAKAENGNVVTVDNGDLIQGTPLGTYKAIIEPVKEGEQHPMYAALEALGFDASTLGNHEFNYGLDYLNSLLKTADIPVVNANVRDAKTNELAFKPFVITPKTFKDSVGREVIVNIGITGIVPPQILSWDKANLEGKVVVQDSVEAITAIVPEMRKAGADIVLVLSHSGIGDDKYERGEENVGYQIAGIPGVDAVVTGHSHAEFPSGQDTGFYESYEGVDGVSGLINGTPVTMGGKYGDHLGIIDLNITYNNGKWGVNKDKSRASIRKIDTKSPVASPVITAIAEKAHAGTIAYVRQQVGTTTAPITSYFALVKDDPSVQIVNNAQLWYAKQELAGTPEANLPLLSAAAPFKAGTRGDATAYTDIPAGPVAIKNVADLYLYDNVTAIIKVTGADLKEWLEMSAGQFNQVDPTSSAPQLIVNPDYRTYNFDIIDGLTYEYDITQPNKYDRNGKLVNEGASRLRNLRYNGQEVSDTQEFMVVTNNYRANGNFPGVVNASVNRLLNLENRQAIINYIVAEKTINPSADNNWRFADTVKGLDLRFLTADKAKDLVSGMNDVVYLNTSDKEGFGEFKLLYTEPTTNDDKGVTDTTPTNHLGHTGTQGLTEKDRQHIHQLVENSYKAQTAKDQQPSASKKAPVQATAKKLPQTGEKESALLSLIGLGVISSLAIRLRKHRN